MGGSFAWTIPLIQTGFGILFLAAYHAGAAKEARIWGIAFLLTAAAFAVPVLEPVLPITMVAVAADTLFALAFFHYAGALLTRYGGRSMRRTRFALLAVSIAAPAFGIFAIGTLAAELVASDVTCALQLGFALALVPRWPARRVDRGIIALSWLTIVENLARTASIPFTAADATFSTFLGTDYDYLMQATALLIGFAFAMLALISVMSDVVAGHRRDANIDPLTGFLNRRGLEAFAAEKLAGRAYGVVGCDLDHFKRVNDTWGHDAGDRVLVAFARLIDRQLPVGAFAARVGGEEFVIVAPGADMQQALALASRLQTSMSAHDWNSAGIVGPQSASFGVAKCESGKDGTFADVLRKADERLYEAKRAGRDRIVGLAAA